MAPHSARWAARMGPSFVALLFSLAVVVPFSSAAGQYFGRNKVQYEQFQWKILRSDHFDNYFYPSESLIVRDAGRDVCLLESAGNSQVSSISSDAAQC